MYSLWCREIFNHNKRWNNWCLSIIIAKVWINGLQFAICKQVLVVKEWHFVLFSKIAISNPSYFPLEMFSWLFLSIKWYTWRHILHLKKVLLITVCYTNACYLFEKNAKILHCKNAKKLLASIFFCESTFFPKFEPWTQYTSLFFCSLCRSR